MKKPKNVRSSNKYNYGKQPQNRKLELERNPITPAILNGILMNRLHENISFAITIALYIALMVTVVALNIEDKAEKDITRPYTEILKEVEEEPEDITKEVYESKIPDIVQKDINKMLESKEDIKIVYYSKNKEHELVIKQNINRPSISFESTSNSHASLFYDSIVDNISFYKNGDDLVIYGGNDFRREVTRYTMNNEGIDIDFYKDSKMDLFGTGIKANNYRTYNKETTLINQGKNFMFYRLGKQIGKTFEFPGGNIVEWTYYYILDDNNDLYYLYYYDDLKKPWMKFVKVAEKIEGIYDSNQEYFYIPAEPYDAKIEIPIYIKNGKKYAAVTNMETEVNYGQNYKRGKENKDPDNIDFSYSTIEISSDAAKEITIYTQDSYLVGKEWRLKCVYEADGKKGIFSKRVNGLDEGIFSLIPEEEVLPFYNKTFSPDELKSTIAELKAIYKKYEDNQF